MKKHLFLNCCFLMVTIAFSTSLTAQIGYNDTDQNLRQNYKRANPLYLKAEKAFAQNDLTKAEELVNKCLALMPEHANATFLLAQLQLKQQNFPLALETMIQAKERFKVMSQLVTFTHQEYMNSLREKIEGLEQSRENMENALSALPANSTSRAQYEGQLAKVRAQIDSVQNQLKDPIPQTYDTPANYHYIHGNILFRLRRLSEAEEQYNNAIKADPTHSNAYNNLSLVFFSLNRFTDAMDCLIRAESAGAKINPDFKKALQEKIK